MNKTRILCIVGTRPEAIKMAPVIMALKARPERFETVVCLTAQHREMLDSVMGLFSIEADLDLDLMRKDQSLADFTSRALTSLDAAVDRVRPDWILAQGDTTTVLAAGLVAFFRGIRFGHVEAGLRTGDRRQPFPEEINRRVADLVSDLYFAPTERARRTLLAEGVDPGLIHVTGNTVVDALLHISGLRFTVPDGPLSAAFRADRLVLITAHRRESFGPAFRDMCLAMRDLAERFAPEGVLFVYPVHLNPNVQRPVKEILSGKGNFLLTEPVDYLTLVNLMKRSSLILTDSGGIQEEAPTFGVPLLVMREKTERPEGIEAGVARLVGTSRENIFGEAARILGNPAEAALFKRTANPYGDGKAASRIAAALDAVGDRKR